MKGIGFLEYLLEGSVGAAVLIPLVLIARRFFRVRVGSRAIYLAWLLVALRLLIPLSLPNPLLVKDVDAPQGVSAPVPESSAVRVPEKETTGRTEGLIRDEPLPSAPFEPAWTGGRAPEAIKPAAQAGITVANLSGARNAPPALRDLPEAAAREPLSVEQRILCAYAAGAAAVALYMLIANLRFRRRIARSQAGSLTGEAWAAYEALCGELRMRPLPAAYADPLSGACLVGTLRPRIFLPLAIRRADVRFTLLHELCHAKAGDGLWGLLRNVCCVLFWFHPLVWLGAHLSRMDAEMACDERVSERLSAPERVDYAEMLVRATARRGMPGIGVLATGMSMNGRRMKARVVGIVRSRAVRRSALAVAALVGVALLVVSFATAEVEPYTINGVPVETPEMDMRRQAARDFLREVYGIDDVGGLENVVPSQYNEYVQVNGNTSTGGAVSVVVDASGVVVGAEGGLLSRIEVQDGPAPSAAQIGEAAKAFAERHLALNGERVEQIEVAENEESFEGVTYRQVELGLSDGDTYYRMRLRLPDLKVDAVKLLNADGIPKTGAAEAVESLPERAAIDAAKRFAALCGFEADDSVQVQYGGSYWRANIAGEAARDESLRIHTEGGRIFADREWAGKAEAQRIPQVFYLWEDGSVHERPEREDALAKEEFEGQSAAESARKRVANRTGVLLGGYALETMTEDEGGLRIEYESELGAHDGWSVELESAEPGAAMTAMYRPLDRAEPLSTREAEFSTRRAAEEKVLEIVPSLFGVQAQEVVRVYAGHETVIVYAMDETGGASSWYVTVADARGALGENKAAFAGERTLIPSDEADPAYIALASAYAEQEAMRRKAVEAFSQEGELGENHQVDFTYIGGSWTGVSLAGRIELYADGEVSELYWNRPSSPDDADGFSAALERAGLFAAPRLVSGERPQGLIWTACWWDDACLTLEASVSGAVGDVGWTREQPVWQRKTLTEDGFALQCAVAEGPSDGDSARRVELWANVDGEDYVWTEEVEIAQSLRVKTVSAKASVLGALQLPIEGIAVAPGACVIDWNLPESGLASVRIHDADGILLTDAAVPGGTHAEAYPSPYGRTEPWTFTLTQNDLSVTTFSMDAAGEIISYDAGIRPDEALRTEQAFVEGVTDSASFAEASERAEAVRLSRLAGSYYDAEGEAKRQSLVLRATGSGVAGIGGTDDRCEVYEAFGRVRKYLAITREGEEKHWAFRVQADPPRVLSMHPIMTEADGARELDAYVVYPTAGEVIERTRSFLMEQAGWSERDVNPPVLSYVRSGEGARTTLYGESSENARDLWQAEYVGVHRHVSDFWRVDVLGDSPEQRAITEAEQTLAARLARELAEKARVYSYGEAQGVEVEDQIYAYGAEEIARVRISYQNGESHDRAYVRLNPPAVLALVSDPDLEATVNWPDAEVPTETLAALGLPIESLRLTSSACDMDWKEIGGWTARWVDAEGRQFALSQGARLLRHETPFGRPAPWTLTFERDGLALHTLVLDEDARILSYAYGGYPDDEVIETRPGLGHSGLDVEPEVKELLSRVGGVTVWDPMGSQFTEVRALVGEVRKYRFEIKDKNRYYATAQTNGERILTFYPEDETNLHYMNMIFAPTREEAVQQTRTFLLETAGWLPEEVDAEQLTVIDRPSAGERYGYEFYGESKAGVRDLWYGRFLGGWRHLDAFWRQEVLEDASDSRLITEAERSDVEAYAIDFVNKTREMYSTVGLTAEVADTVRVYDCGEVVRVYVDDAFGGGDTLHVRLTPRSVLYQERGGSGKEKPAQT